jgi:hypothetical protein
MSLFQPRESKGHEPAGPYQAAHAIVNYFFSEPDKVCAAPMPFPDPLATP